jgi:hypothetical protein
VRDDLLTIMRPVGRSRLNARTAAVLPCIVPEFKRSPKLAEVFQKVVEPRRELMRDVLRRGIASGELRADLDIPVIVTMLTAPMVAQSVFRWDSGIDRNTLPERILAAAWPALVA